MGLVCRIGRFVPALIVSVGVLTPLGQAPSQAQVLTSRFEPIEKFTLDLADSSTRTHLERAKALQADEQWDDAVEILRQLMENHGGKMFELADQRYISLRDYCQLRIACLPEPALQLYRDRVDPQARRLFERGIATRDRGLLKEVTRQYFASSYGDQALYALGELALSEADYPAARNYWSTLIELPQEPIPLGVFERVRSAPSLGPDDARLLDRWYLLKNTDSAPYYVINRSEFRPDDVTRSLVRLWNRYDVLPTRMAFPATDVPLADVRARLILAYILDGSTELARTYLGDFSHLHPEAEGRLAGRSGKYVELLGSLLESSTQWPAIAASQTWQTFAGNPQRNFVAAERLDLGELAWQRPLEKVTASDSRVVSSFGLSTRPSEDSSSEHHGPALMSYHPIVVGNLVLVAGAEKIFAWHLDTGAPAWGSADGTIFKVGDAAGRNGTRHSQLGAPRFTLSAHDNLLFARIGSPVTSSVVESPFAPTGAVLKWFDLGAQAALLKDALPGDEKWSFDGVPLSDGSQAYVAMRQGEAGPQTQAHVACFDVQTGKLRWRRFVCAADTPGRSQMDEITHNLLSLDRGVLYFNTNLGAVAALSTDDGEVLWISRYPRSKGGDLNRTARHVYRDLNPCVLDQGRVFVAPADSEQVFAFNAHTGAKLWSSVEGSPEDAVHLLGVLGNTLVASGDKLWGFDATEGKVRAVWPDSSPPRGFGRGVLMGDEVIWPTRQELYHFRLDRRVVRDPLDNQAKEIFWWQNTHIDNLLNQSAAGGNLVVAKDYLLIATSDTLYAFRRYGEKKPQ